METCTIRINCDTRPLLAYVELLEKSFGGLLKTLDLPPELVRVESDTSTAATGELMVRLYPSDALLSFAAALGARDANCRAVEKSGHDKSPCLANPPAKRRPWASA